MYRHTNCSNVVYIANPRHVRTINDIRTWATIDWCDGLAFSHGVVGPELNNGVYSSFGMNTGDKRLVVELFAGLGLYFAYSGENFCRLAIRSGIDPTTDQRSLTNMAWFLSDPTWYSSAQMFCYVRNYFAGDGFADGPIPPCGKYIESCMDGLGAKTEREMFSEACVRFFSFCIRKRANDRHLARHGLLPD